MSKRLDVYVRGLTRPKFNYFYRQVANLSRMYKINVKKISYRSGILSIEYEPRPGVNSAFLPLVLSILTGIGVQTLSYMIRDAMMEKLEHMDTSQAFITLVVAFAIILLIGAFILMALNPKSK